LNILKLERQQTRSNMPHHISFFALVALVCANRAFATVVKTNTYEVEGCNLAEVWADIKKKGPGDHAGEAVTEIKASFDPPTVACKEVPMEECPEATNGWECTISLCAKYPLETEIKIPSWPGGATLPDTEECKETKKEWDRFLEKLTEHEKGHDKKVQDALDAATPKTKFTKTFMDCNKDKAVMMANDAQPALEMEFQKEAKRLEGVAEKANEKYDEDTNHGETEGATLDTSKTCAKPKTPKEQLEDMVFELEFGDREELAKKLEKAIKEIEEGRTKQAKTSIENFIKDVEKAKKDKKNPLDKEAADDFIERANKAKDGLPEEEGKKLLRS